MAKRRSSRAESGPRRRTRKSGATVRRHRRRRFFRIVLGVSCVLAGLALAGYVLWVDYEVRQQFEGKRWQVPARIYARPLALYPGAGMDPVALEAELRVAGYQPGSSARPGEYLRRGNSIEVNLRAFRFWDGLEPQRRLTVDLAGGKVVGIRDQRDSVALVRFEPALIGRIYPQHGEDRVLVRLNEVPPVFVKALLSVEDRGFYRHLGVSFRSILRALWANLRAGQTVQGGSTITQQLAKNFFLTPERTLRRKLNEALIALLLEIHYGKAEILEAYLNEVYLGQQGRRAVHGFGLASSYYFGRRLDELEIHEVALLVAMVRGPSYYDPRKHPRRTKLRRNRVLDTMAAQGAISDAGLRAAKARPLGILQHSPSGQTRFPAFMDLVWRQLRRDYRDADLRSEGLQIFTTLDPLLQRRAESALAANIPRFEARSGSLKPGMLQGAVILTDAGNAEVLAVVGGRDPREPGFNRALDARRPIGSLVKPAVYLAALEHPDRFTLISELEDAPVRLKDRRGQIWSPKNYDGTTHGRVPLYQGLAQSYNLATVNLGLEVGVGRVVNALKRLGVEQEIAPYPSVLLGSVELSPVEVAQVYQTIAGGGFRTPLRAIREVTDARGQPLNRYPLTVEQSVAPGPAYLLNFALQAVMREGTGRSAYQTLPTSLNVAGKTGTTDDLRDSWFAGFTGNHLAVVWLGRDDNRPTGLSGAGGALQVWSKLVAGIRNTKGVSPPVPENVLWAAVDGNRPNSGCQDGRTLPFVRGSDRRTRPCREINEPFIPAPALSAERN